MNTQLNYLKLISSSYPTMRSVITELINLNAILNLPKGTEHFVSDIHGEYEAFSHIMNNCSGVIREKVDAVFGNSITNTQKSELCTLIYYPSEKLRLIKENGKLDDTWCRSTLGMLIELCKMLSSKYTRSKVRKALPKEYSYIIDELLHAHPDENTSQKKYHDEILASIVNTQSAEDFIVELSKLIKVLAVDRLHIVGDIFDRGPNPEKVMDLLMQHHNVDIQWGNHDILWMGAAAGSEVCIVTAIRNSVVAGNYEFLESGYGISLRPLALFAKKMYPHEETTKKSIIKAISIILFKLESQIIKRNPDFNMTNRLLLDNIDYENWTLSIEGKKYQLNKNDYITVSPNCPDTLTDDEIVVLQHFKKSFLNSALLQTHIQFLYQKGSIYKSYNQNLLYHGCIPLESDGSYTKMSINGKEFCGKELLEEFELIARKSYFENFSEKSENYLDWMWYLWCGSSSPLFGRSKMTTFERMYINDISTHHEEKNAYYTLCDEESVCRKILHDFGLYSDYSHIINGHVPVKVSEGESPIKGNGHLFFIDGGFCKAYQKTTGIAGYTLVFNSHGMRILSHRPFQGVEAAIQNNDDIQTHCDLIETDMPRIFVKNTDVGREISSSVDLLNKLLEAYRSGEIVPKY